jgi:hypothetical protein
MTTRETLAAEWAEWLETSTGYAYAIPTGDVWCRSCMESAVDDAVAGTVEFPGDYPPEHESYDGDGVPACSACLWPFSRVHPGNVERIEWNGAAWVDEMERYGYTARLGGAYVCYTCGHVCDGHGDTDE